MMVHWQQTGVIEYRKLDLVSGNRSADHSVDCYRNYKSWKNQYRCYGSIIYPDTDSLQSHLLQEAEQAYHQDDSMTFGAAVELAVAMPLSWLPLISDYTREAKEPVKATAVSAIAYGIVSCWMYVIGMGAAIYYRRV